jgi:hypothetical protein
LTGRSGTCGTGATDWWRNDWEFVVCAANSGRLPWSDPTALGQPPQESSRGESSHRNYDGRRANNYGTKEERARKGSHRAQRDAGRAYIPPDLSNPGNVIEGIV